MFLCTFSNPCGLCADLCVRVVVLGLCGGVSGLVVGKARPNRAAPQTDNKENPWEYVWFIIKNENIRNCVLIIFYSVLCSFCIIILLSNRYK